MSRSVSAALLRGKPSATSRRSLPLLDRQKTRPMLDHRMPTLANKTTFLVPLDDKLAAKTRSGLKRLEKRPPRNLKDVRHVLASEIKLVQKKVQRLEAAYYGVGKSLTSEVEKYAVPLKMLIRMLTYFELPSTKAVEAAIKNGSDPKRYKGDPKNVLLLKEVYAKVLAFVPSKFHELCTNCEHILDYLKKYCTSFYEPEGDVEAETAAHYEAQIRKWTSNIKDNLEKVDTLHKHFKARGIHYTMFSSPVATFCQRKECELVPFLFLFAEACTNVRSALSIMSMWIQADENYPTFLHNDIRDLENQKEEQIKCLRDARERYSSATYKLNQAEIEHAKMIADIEALKEKDEATEIEEARLKEKLNELELDLEFKESRKEDLRAKSADMDLDSLTITWENLQEEMRSLRERIPQVSRQLVAAQHRIEWMKTKREALATLEKELTQLNSDLKQIEQEKLKREQDFEAIEKTLELCRRIHLYKTSEDLVQKIFYNLPITCRNTRAKLPSISTNHESDLDKACAVVAESIDQDWVNLYRNLPFFPKRGAETIEKDIGCIQVECSRGPKDCLPAIALSRWRRHHTRARAVDLKDGLKAIKRLDVLKSVELTLNPPPVPQREETYFPPDLDPGLYPHYRDVLKFDRLLAANRIQVVQLPPEDECY